MQPTLNQFHEQLVREAIPDRLSDEDVMLLFTILHLNEIEIHPGVVRDLSDDCRTISAITQRDAGEVVASLFKQHGKKADDHRTHYTHWYWLWNGDWGAYGHAENLSAAEQARMQELREQLLAHPWVVDLREED